MGETTWRATQPLEPPDIPTSPDTIQADYRLGMSGNRRYAKNPQVTEEQHQYPTCRRRLNPKWDNAARA
ncbi:Hypothetical predicted protein [Pelobates cultripes]|uniref:Uncharacterized protein n=1 Tax=Pelobates cultripes TaxID=61616 RepID=A0AAD1RME7_PELCU|nr:Hypothetical predicted protein [Pelobates cultripes]